MKDINCIQCHECALHIDVPSLKVAQKAVCPRCGCVLKTRHKNALQRIFVFAFSALIFLFMSLVFEFLSFTRNGLDNSFTLLDSLIILMQKNYHLLALIEMITVFLIPFTVLVVLMYLSFYLLKGHYPHQGSRLLQVVFTLLPWSMVEIFLIGALVSIVKILSMADISLGLSFYCFCLFSLFMTLVVLHLDKQQFIQLLAKTHAKDSSQAATDHGLEQLLPVGHKVSHKKYSVQYTWALIITAIVVYIPANILPIMTTRLFGQDEPNTILGGVIVLWEMGSFPIAIIIFIASIVVPIGKILILAWLNFTVQKPQYELTKARIKSYRIAEFIGRWSMIDVFVVIVLVSMIQLGDTMSIFPGKAIIAFCGVVVLTMLAAMSFDSTLIWSAPKPEIPTDKNKDDSDYSRRS
jgi:paraquat-inducible protein A